MGRGASVSANLRGRAEQLQTQIWIRNIVLLFSAVICIGAFVVNARGVWSFHETVTLAMTIGWVGAAWQSCRALGWSKVIPWSLSPEQLRAFHRRELIRHMNLGCRAFVYGSVPAIVLILYALAVGSPSFRGGPMLLGAIAMQNLVIAQTYRMERGRYRRELDLLDREADLV
ncbi:MAG: hypothetical protein JNK87_17780 [Bryobacterales bacterium]|nr:hypothetical protein [Bryobacterales bacterium]